MSSVPEANGSRGSASVERLREQIAQDRRELAETVTALRAKTDIAGRLHDKAASVPIAAAGAVGHLGRSMSAMVQRPLRILLAVWGTVAAMAAITAIRRWQGR